MTLMACYGLPYDPECDTRGGDLDGDGYCADNDCDDSDFTVHPFAADEAGDGVDQNCDGADGIADADAGPDAGGDIGPPGT